MLVAALLKIYSLGKKPGFFDFFYEEWNECMGWPVRLN